MTTPPRPDQQIDPPTAVVAPGGAAGTFRGRLVVIFGSSATGGTGLYVYKPTPAAGNLIAAIVPGSGHDAYGDAVLPTIASYGQTLGNFYASTLASGELQFWIASSEAGPYTQYASIGVDFDGDGDLFVTSDNATNVILNYDGTVGTAINTGGVCQAYVNGALETWHSMGSPSISGWTVQRNRYRFNPMGGVDVDVQLVSTSSVGGFSTSIGSVASAYIPNITVTGGISTDTTITAVGNNFPGVKVTSLGDVTLQLPPSGGAGAHAGGSFSYWLT